jgi:Rrf2 family nitric oxide-sensitive transcriptional repressor
MQITRQADYAVRAVLFLARSGDQRIATNMIAEDQRIPPSFLAKIVSQLSIAGLLHTSRGARGGVTLARAAKEISARTAHAPSMITAPCVRFGVRHMNNW